ncbi:MAG: hypothetical protein KDC95_17030 [Planctomycetes bacterium]|nr:hypothetical protein [Planctomycetota bacterium]
MNKLVLPALAVLAVPLFAQTGTLHPKGANPLGNTNNNIPMSWYATRYHQIQEYTDFEGAARPITMSNLDFRMASGFGSGNYGGFSTDVAVWLSLTPSTIDGANFSTTFANNIDTASQKQVIKRRTIVPPKLANNNFDFKIPFDTGTTFVYTGMLAKRHLLLEIRTYGTTINTYPLDAYRQSTTAVGSSVRNGTYLGCQPSGVTSMPVHTADPATLVIGNTTTFKGSGYEASNPPGVLVLGFTPLNITLPGGCNLMNDLALLLVAPSTGSNADVSFSLGIPNAANLANATFYTQMFWFKQGITPINVYSANGLTNTISGGPTTGLTRIYAYSSAGINPDTVTTATGSTQGYGLVTQYR